MNGPVELSADARQLLADLCHTIDRIGEQTWDITFVRNGLEALEELNADPAEVWRPRFEALPLHEERQVVKWLLRLYVRRLIGEEP